MIAYTYHPQDVYSVAIFEDGFMVAGSTFHTRAEAEAYAAPLIAQGYTARGTAPSYDRVYLDSMSRPATVSPFRQWRDAQTIGDVDDIDPGFGDEF